MPVLFPCAAGKLNLPQSNHSELSPAVCLKNQNMLLIEFKKMLSAQELTKIKAQRQGKGKEALSVKHTFKDEANQCA